VVLHISKTYPAGVRSAPLYEVHGAGEAFHVAIAPFRLFSGGPGQPPLDPRQWARPGVYFKLGAPATPWGVYAGSSGDLLDRVSRHAREDPSHRVILAFLPGMTRTHAEQVEGHLILQLRDDRFADVIDLKTLRGPRVNPDDLPPHSDFRTLVPGLETALQLGGLDINLEI